MRSFASGLIPGFCAIVASFDRRVLPSENKVEEMNTILGVANAKQKHSPIFAYALCMYL
jgi:hypothetical protein